MSMIKKYPSAILNSGPAQTWDCVTHLTGTRSAGLIIVGPPGLPDRILPTLE